MRRKIYTLLNVASADTANNVRGTCALDFQVPRIRSTKKSLCRHNADVHLFLAHHLRWNRSDKLRRASGRRLRNSAINCPVYAALNE